VTDLNMALPLPVLSAGMSGGSEGATPGDNEYIGSDLSPKSGMFLLGDAPDLNFFSIPGITTVAVERAAADWADLTGRLIAILDAPLADDEALEVLNFSNIEANFDTSYAALYYPWVIVRDPKQNNARVALPPSGFIQGVYAQVGATRGFHYAPANVALRGVLDLTHNCTDGEQDILNPAGINVIRSFQGEGIRVWGARTLTTYKDGRHYVNVRRTLNYVKESLRSGLRFAIFELNEQRTWRVVEQVCNEFFGTMFDRGQLFSPDGTPERAFFAKCDAETNPDSERREGRMNVECGVNPQLPAEFIVVRVGLWDGGSTVEEELARR
jgi:phage tail sheath protein FI